MQYESIRLRLTSPIQSYWSDSWGAKGPDSQSGVYGQLHLYCKEQGTVTHLLA